MHISRWIGLHDACAMFAASLIFVAGMSTAATPSAALDATTVEALRAALDDERHAKAMYAAVLERFGEVRPFANIIHAEGRHEAAVRRLFETYDLDVPNDRWAGAEFDLPETLREICALAVEAEIANVALYDRYLDHVAEPEVQRVFTSLRNASRDRHLPAFQRCAEGRGGGRAMGRGRGRGQGHGRGRGPRWQREQPQPPTTRTAESIEPVAPIDDYVLVWRDEFDGETLDETKWNHSRLGPRRDAINVREAISLDGDGHLRITTSRHTRDDGSVAYHTGMLDTHGRFDTTGGYFEARLKLQTEVGHWSAFWLQTPTMGEPVGDPATAGTEIDIVEYLCNEPNRGRVHHTLHWDGYGEHHQSAHALVDAPQVTHGFHTFGLLWTAEEYVFFIDGKETWRTSRAVSKRDQYMLLSLEVGAWAGDIADAELPDSLIVDYVRVFKPRER